MVCFEAKSITEAMETTHISPHPLTRHIAGEHRVEYNDFRY